MLISHTKAQVTIEFAVVLSLLIIALLFIYYDFNNEKKSMEKELFDLAMENLVYKSATILNTAFVEGDGYTTTLKMPELEWNYEVIVDSGYLLLRINNRSYTSLLLSSDLEGNIAPSQTNTVRNDKGRLFVE